MSFILDALRKSEHERQRQAGPGLAELRPASTRSTFPVWALALGALLAVNLGVLAVLMLRDVAPIEPAAPRAAVPLASPAPEGATRAPDSASASGAAATAEVLAPPSASAPPATGLHGRDPPVRPGSELRAYAAEDAASFDELAEEPQEAEPELQPPPRAAASDEESIARLPTMKDVTLRGTALPELHLDIHVYAAQPAERFVFLNNRKYREGSETPEGTVIERITRDGVVLSHRGVRFLLPRT